MPSNHVSGTLTAADRQAVIEAMKTAQQKLPFLIDLKPEERRNLPRMGDKTRAFVERALEVASGNPDILPRGFDLEEFQRDAELLRSLYPVAQAVEQLNEFVDDTMLALGSDAYTAALLVYQAAKIAGSGGALDAQLDALGQRFARKNSGEPAPVPAAAH
ncbi:MAG: hypothetical protein IT577_11180 [Verrucomicrobiae bacterium]|nr:hypothetical protein [Verrucomicrobiae bacterium]